MAALVRAYCDELQQLATRREGAHSVDAAYRALRACAESLSTALDRQDSDVLLTTLKTVALAARSPATVALAKAEASLAKSTARRGGATDHETMRRGVATLLGRLVRPSRGQDHPRPRTPSRATRVHRTPRASRARRRARPSATARSPDPDPSPTTLSSYGHTPRAVAEVWS